MVTSSNENISRATGHRFPVNSPHKGQWRWALMLTLICARINGWVNNREASDLRCFRAHYDVIVMITIKTTRHHKLCEYSWMYVIETHTLTLNFNCDVCSVPVTLQFSSAWPLKILIISQVLFEGQDKMKADLQVAPRCLLLLFRHFLRMEYCIFKISLAIWFYNDVIIW